MKPFLALLCAPLAACAVVSVQADGGRPQVGVYPLGVHIARGDARAVSVSARTVGLWSAPFSAGLGAAHVEADVIDAKACSAALVHARTADPTIIGRLAGAARAVCPKGEP